MDSNRAHESDHVTFRHANLLADRLPAVDLVLCRDGFVHFCYRDIWLALRNICRSGSSYLLTTTFPKRHNRDIWTGDWRPLNLEAEPFNLSQPLELIVEGCTESGGEFADKSLGLWRIDDLSLVAGRATRQRRLAGIKRFFRYLEDTPPIGGPTPTELRPSKAGTYDADHTRSSPKVHCASAWAS